MLSECPRIAEFVAELPERDDTPIYSWFTNPDYAGNPFWQEFEYFLSNTGRFVNHHSVLKRLCATAPSSLEIDKAWNKWRIFRSAQFEITVIFLIENYLLGQVLELIPEGSVPTPDFKVRLGRSELKIEAKAQSGQQHGDKHPRELVTLFDPRDENDLRSWLFEEKPSSRTGEPMTPMALEAEWKGADVLVAQTDYGATMSDIKSQVSILCPVNRFVKKMTVGNKGRRPIIISFFKVEYPCCRKQNGLKEIWLYNLNSLDRFIVLSRNDTLLLNHLKGKR